MNISPSCCLVRLTICIVSKLSSVPSASKCGVGSGDADTTLTQFGQVIVKITHKKINCVGPAAEVAEMRAGIVLAE